MPQLPPEILKEIVKHWDDLQPLCSNCEPYWNALPWACRKEIRHNYDFENDEI